MEPEAEGAFESFDVSPEECLTVIHSLSPAYRTVFNMRVFEEMTHKDIAESLGITESTSKANYSKARVILSNRLTEFMNNRKSEEDAKKELCRVIDTESRR
jgi:RNA polymerase sigma-70 factor (ECF subfamily)